MNFLARLTRTDKFSSHKYTPIYGRHFSKFRGKRINLLEIGVGGYENDPGGASLVLWRAYFRRARIAAIDIYDKTHLSRGRVQVFQCSQTDAPALERICDSYGGFDIIIDDGSHVNAHQIETFGILYPYLRDGGVYVVEDVQTSYWSNFGGGAVGTPGYERSCMNFFKGFIDGVNYEEFLDADYIASDFDRTIMSVEFHHNLIILTKGRNEDGSPMVAEMREKLLRDSTEEGNVQ